MNKSNQIILVGRFLRLFVAGLMITCSKGECQFRPRAHSAVYSDALLSVKADLGAGGLMTLLIHHKNGTETRIKLPGNPWTVTSIHGTQYKKALILSDEGEDESAVYVLDELSSSIIDEFHSFLSPSVSPNGRFVIFTRMFVQHPGSSDNVDDSNYAMLYDASEAPDQNRSKPSHEWVLDHVGQMIYPSTDAPQLSRHGGEAIGHNFPWKYVWSADSSKVIFFDEQTPGDPISEGAFREGNLIASPRVRPSTALNLVLIDFSGAEPVVRKLDTGLCHILQETAGCYPSNPKFTFGSGSVTIDDDPPPYSNKPLHVAYNYSAFHRP